MSINIIQLLESVLSDDVVKTLASRFGVTPDLARKVTGTAAPALLAAIMHRSSTADGAHALFSTIMSPDVNAQIGKQLPGLPGSTADMEQLATTGRGLIEKATGTNLGTLANAVAEHTGAPVAAASSLSGIVGASLLGILKQHFTASQGAVGQLPALLGQQLPVVSAGLTDKLAGAVGLGSVAAFGGSILSRLKDVSSHLSPTAPAQAVAVDRKEGCRCKKSWLWWLIALVVVVLLFWLLRSCQHEKPVAQGNGVVPASSVSAAQPASTPAATKDSHLSFVVDKAGVPALTATVGSEAEKAQLLDALKKKFGDGHFKADVTVDPTVKPAGWLAHLDGLLPLMAVPGAEVNIDGTHVELGGAAADARLGWTDKLKALFGSAWNVSMFNAQNAVANAAQSFRDAIKGLFAGDAASCAGENVAKVLNLQIVNFATASARIPASAIDDLKQSAAALQACTKHGKPVQLEVAGYSDNRGNPKANEALSLKRAQSVRGYLVAQGVSPDALIAQGYGDARPVDSNDTESGRFHNRRIEFTPQASQ